MSTIYIPATSPEDWKNFLAEPDKQWKTGYSAKTLAYCWHEADGFPNNVKQVLKNAGSPFDTLEPLLIIPEHKVPLPGGAAASQNDIWVLAKSGTKLISIAVEGKVYETFGPTIGEWLQKDSPGKQERLKYLMNLLSLHESIPKTIRYQLIHRTASAIIEAKRFNATQAMMLVHSFSQANEWFDDYKRFLELFDLEGNIDSVVSKSDIQDIVLHFAWVKGEEKYLQV